MNVAIRVDASAQIGTGHFIRCLTLANELKQRGAKTLFVSRHLPDYMRSMLETKDHEFVLLDNTQNNSTLDGLSHSHWLGVSQEKDAIDSVKALTSESWDWLIVDHYALDSRWELKLRQSVKKIFVIDDIADRKHDCDLLLDQNFYNDMELRYEGKVPSHCQLLLGPRYSLLRSEFRALHEQIKPRNGTVKRILVFFGGVDADNYTGYAIKALSEINIPEWRVDVVIGSQHPFLEQNKSDCEQYGYICHVQTDKMAELMATADLAIGAGGSATWERCCLGLPALSICVADNQKKQIADAAQEGFIYAPQIGEDLIVTIKNHLITLLENENLRNLISRKGMQAVDGLGVVRIINHLGCSEIVIRKASANDSSDLFEWRNHPSIRAVSRNTELITWEDHQEWFDSVLCSKDRALLIGYNNEMTVGVVRFDYQEEFAEVSIYLVPDSDNLGE